MSYEHYRRLRGRVCWIIERCTNPLAVNYDRYGALGVQVYPEWLEDPHAFVLHLATLDGWDDPKLTVDRIDGEGHYWPGNLQFATRREQSQNRRSFRKGITHVDGCRWTMLDAWLERQIVKLSKKPGFSVPATAELYCITDKVIGAVLQEARTGVRHPRRLAEEAHGGN